MGLLDAFEDVDLLVQIIIFVFDGGLGVLNFLTKTPPLLLHSFHPVFTLFVHFTFSTHISLEFFNSILSGLLNLFPVLRMSTGADQMILGDSVGSELLLCIILLLHSRLLFGGGDDEMQCLASKFMKLKSGCGVKSFTFFFLRTMLQLNGVSFRP